MASVYSAAAELIGLVLKFLTSQYDDCSELEDIVVKRITDMMYERERQSQALNCVYYIHKHYAPIIRRFINKILNLLPKLYGIYRTRVMECIVSYSASMEDVFIHLKEQNLLETLTRKEPSTQLVGLQLVNSVMLRLQPSELLYFMPGITAFINHQAPRCREQMYDVLFWIYDNYNDSLEGDGSQLEMESRSILLQAVKDQDAILKQKVLNFWLEG
ncbi:hypothetical protein SK128_028363 [Halocaridina rubra]|uniref:DNA-dependent protein kinase catalytic subunit CC5 domain-containing protein n=1 Tax=Halocaridina rubra TaxID=373956 RepID=A0AAN8WN34_HALRR